MHDSHPLIDRLRDVQFSVAQEFGDDNRNVIIITEVIELLQQLEDSARLQSSAKMRP
jgi:hypothetical protein